MYTVHVKTRIAVLIICQEISKELVVQVKEIRVYLFGRRRVIFTTCEQLRRRQLKESLLLYNLKYFRYIINALYVV